MLVERNRVDPAGPPPSSIEAPMNQNLPDIGDPVPDLERREPLRELTLGRSPPPQPIHGDAGSRADAEAEEVERLRQGCWSKAEAIRWQVECHQGLWEGVESPIDEAPVDPERIAWSGRLVDCFYWLDAEDPSRSANFSLLDDVGGCYEAMAEGLGLIVGVEGRRGKLERALPLLAEAQSMLRAALQRLRAPADPDQVTVYQMVRDAAARHRIFVRRHLRTDDPADPTGWPGLLSRIEMAAGGPTSRPQREKLDRIREHLEPIGRGDGTEEDWQAIITLAEEAIGEGLPPSNREIRELLLPFVDAIPDREDLPPGFRLVLREIDRYLATRPGPSQPPSKETTPTEIKEAARLLAGRSVVLIGGIRRREAQEALRRAFRLKDLIWIQTREHQSIEPFESIVARPDVALVLLAIRWSSHSFGDVRQFCIRHGKRLVRLPGGYGPQQVAVQILAQASEGLRGEKEEGQAEG